jgi:Transposase domain (DUF772)
VRGDLNLAYRWFCDLGLDRRVPNHSTFSRNRNGRFRDSDILRLLFETALERCLREGHVGGEGFALNASLIAADANKQRSVPGNQWPIAGLEMLANSAGRTFPAHPSLSVPPREESRRSRQGITALAKGWPPPNWRRRPSTNG